MQIFAACVSRCEAPLKPRASIMGDDSTRSRVVLKIQQHRRKRNSVQMFSFIRRWSILTYKQHKSRALTVDGLMNAGLGFVLKCSSDWSIFSVVSYEVLFVH